MEWIGIDIGGSHITSVVVDDNFVILSKVTLSINTRDLESVLIAIEKATISIAKSSILKGIGVAVPGNVDPITNHARYLPNFSWGDRSIPLGTLITERLQLSQDIKISMRNDGRCAAIAEAKFGSGKNSKVFAFLTLGTGIGGALLINGKLFDGVSFDAGDFGHHVIRTGADDSFPCACGKRGCFETQASAEGLVRHFKRYLMINKEEYESTSINAEKVIIAMRSGNSSAKQAFTSFLDDLSTGLANLVTFYNPDTIGLGGGLSQAPELFIHIQRLVDEKTLPATRGYVKIVPSVVGVDAGALGAAILAASEHES